MNAASRIAVSIRHVVKNFGALRALDGLGLAMLVVPRAHAPWLEQAAAHTAKIGEDAARRQHAWLEE